MDKILNDDLDKIMNEVDLISLKNKKVLIAGGSGLIGTYLVSLIAKLNTFGYEIDVCATFKTSIPTFLEGRIKFINFDFSVPAKFQADSGFDYIFYGPGYGQPLKFQSRELETLKINSLGLFSVIDLLNKEGQLIYLSSSEIYSQNHDSGNGLDTSLITDLSHPRVSYISSKIFGETICEILYRQGVNTKTMRIALAYGPGSRKDDERVLNKFIRNGVVDGKIQLLDEGKAVRSYCYIADAISMILQATLHGTQKIYNIGGKEIVSILELAQMIADLLPGKIEIRKPTKDSSLALPGSPNKVLLDLASHQTEFKSINSTSLKEGLSRTINWQIDNLYGENKKC